LGVLLSLFSGGFAQQKTAHLNVTKNTAERRADIDFTLKSTPITKNAVALNTNNSVTLERSEIGKSGNAYSVLTSYQRCLAYDENTQSYLATFRADPASYPEALSSGTIIGHTSADGENWNHTIVINPDPNVHALRYPSGVLYNAINSNNPEDLYIVSAGPSHTGGVWDYTYYASVKADGQNPNDYYYEWSQADGNDWARSSMTVVPGAVYNFGLDYTSVGEAGIDQTMKQYVGATDDPADGFNWEYNEVTPDWLVDEVDGNAYALYTTWSAWSKDGSIGYMWMIGVTDDSEEYGGYQPQVFYTEDSGDSWDAIELDMEDNPTLVEYLPAWEDADGNPGTVKPTMGISQGGSRNFPGVVDYEGKLHLFAPVFGASTQSVTDPESGYWTVGGNQGGHIFDIVVNTDGLQDIIFVDSIVSGTPADNIFGEVSWGHRLQASKSVDEKMVFAVWADDRDSDDGTLKNPDIYAWGYNTETGEATDPVNFTEDDLYAGFYFYHYVAELTPNIDGFYEIPVSTTVTPTEFASGDDTAPVTNSFVRGIGFEAPTSTGLETDIAKTSIEVSQNQPNPASDYTSFYITSSNQNEANIEVVNLMGQTVLSQTETITSTNQEVRLNTSELKPGVYFYIVNVGKEKISNKMIIK